MRLGDSRFQVAECCIPFDFLQPFGFEFAIAADPDLGCPSAFNQLLQRPAQAVATFCISGVGFAHLHHFRFRDRVEGVCVGHIRD